MRPKCFSDELPEFLAIFWPIWKKKFFCSFKNTKVSLSQKIFQKKSRFFLVGERGNKCLRSANFGVFGATEKLFFSNRSEFRQEFRELIRKTFWPQLEAVEAIFRNFWEGWGGTFFNFFYFFSYLLYEHISISASWRHCHNFFFQNNWIFSHILFFKKNFAKKNNCEKVGHNHLGIYAKNGKLIPFTSQIWQQSPALRKLANLPECQCCPLCRIVTDGYIDR